MAKTETKKETRLGPGDIVEVDLVKTAYKGTYLEAPKDEKGIILLKLPSGYNIGLNKKDLLDIRVLEKAKEKEEKIELKKNPEKPNIAMIITGGTIASRYDSRTGGVYPLTNSQELFKYYPELFKKVNVVKVEVPFMKWSENMDFRDWKEIAKTAAELLNNPEIKGIIITHGTDTLHYTSAALSFFLKNLNKPVVLTYSQRSTDRASSDATLNLDAAALAAISDMAEVVLVGHSSENDDFCYALKGTKVRKLHTSRRDAFKPVNSKPLAKITESTFIPLAEYRKRNNEKVKTDLKFEEKVALIKFYPGQDPAILDYYAKNGYRGIVIEATGLGQVATEGSRHSWLKKLKEVQKKGIVVCAASQTIYGRLDPFVYSAGREIMDTGVIYLEDMLSETAFVKLGYVLGHPQWKNQIKEKMLENMAGEFSDRLEE